MALLLTSLSVPNQSLIPMYERNSKAELFVGSILHTSL